MFNDTGRQVNRASEEVLAKVGQHRFAQNRGPEAGQPSEDGLHDERRKGELSAEQIAGIWMQVQRESLGPAFDFTEDYGVYWAYIPHFVHSPFYVYAYAFGDCLVNALYGVYRDGSVPGFEQKYLDLLKAGGTLRHKELLAPFGLDASDPKFWQRGLDVIAGFIDELARSPRDELEKPSA